MNARNTSMALDSGTSSDAGAQQSSRTRDRVRAVIVVILREFGPLTDEELADQYLARAGAHPLVPLVTPQRIRTARHSLVLDGLAYDTGAIAFSKLGNRCTVWGLI